MKYLFLINPKAGAGEAEALLRETIDQLPEKNDCEIYRTKSVGDATAFVRG